LACPLSFDEAPLTASAIFATTEVMKEVCGNEPSSRGEKKGALTAGAEGVCVCDRQVVMKAVTEERWKKRWEGVS